MIYTHRTAIKRKGASRPMKDLFMRGYLEPGMSVLDFGCGHGADVRYLGLKRNHSGLVKGFDPHKDFGYYEYPGGRYDVVTMIYVVNVIPDRNRRQKAIYNGWKFVRPGGFLFLACRTEKEVEKLAKKYGWETHRDGYRTKKDTFQRGHNAVDLLLLSRATKSIKSEHSEWHLMEQTRYTGLLLAKRRWI